MASAGLRKELECSICLQLYTAPVTLRCGHNFCRVCIDEVRNTQDGSGVYSCPECRARFKRRPVLKTNITLCNVVENFLSTQKEIPGIRCTYCVDSPVPAVKSCLMCEASLCEKHLRVHSKSAEHVLTEPRTNLGDRKCSVHKKILEYYCTSDVSYICVSCCLIGEHQGHKIEALDKASEKKKEKLRNVLQKLTRKRKKTKERVWSLEERWRKAQEQSSGEVERVTALFADIRRRLDDLEKKVLSEISWQEEQMSLSLSVVIQKLEIQKTELSRKIRHIEELCNITDPLTVLQEPDTGDLLDPEEEGGGEATVGHGGGDEDTGGHDGGDEDTGGHDGGDEDTGGHDGGDEDTGGHDGGDEDTGGHDGGDEDMEGHDGGDEATEGHDGGDEDTGGHYGGDEDTGGQDGGDEDTGGHDGGDEDMEGHDGGDEDTGGHDGGDEDMEGHDGGHEATEGHDGGGEDTRGNEKSHDVDVITRMLYAGFSDIITYLQTISSVKPIAMGPQPHSVRSPPHRTQDLPVSGTEYGGDDVTDRSGGVGGKVMAAGSGGIYVQGPADILLDLNTAANNLIISADLKTATRTEISENLPETSERFQDHQVMSGRGFTSGRHYWDAEISRSEVWVVGMCYPSIDRRGRQSYIGYNNKSWGLYGGRGNNNQYLLFHDSEVIQLPHQISSDRVRICLDYEAGRLSFYELCDPIRHLHTFTTTFTEPLHAGLCVWEGNIKILGEAAAVRSRQYTVKQARYW